MFFVFNINLSQISLLLSLLTWMAYGYPECTCTNKNLFLPSFQFSPPLMMVYPPGSQARTIEFPFLLSCIFNSIRNPFGFALNMYLESDVSTTWTAPILTWSCLCWASYHVLAHRWQTWPTQRVISLLEKVGRKLRNHHELWLGAMADLEV